MWLGSSGLDVPPARLEILQLQPGAKVGVTIESGRLVVEPRQRPRYSWDELLAQCDPQAPRSRKEKEWLGGEPVGDELIG